MIDGSPYTGAILVGSYEYKSGTIFIAFLQRRFIITHFQNLYSYLSNYKNI